MALWTCVIRSSTATKGAPVKTRRWNTVQLREELSNFVFCSRMATKGAPVKTKCWTTSTGRHLQIVSFEPKRNIMQAWSLSYRKQSKCIHICTKVPLPSYFEAKLITQRPQTNHNSRTNLVSIWISFLIFLGLTLVGKALGLQEGTRFDPNATKSGPRNQYTMNTFREWS